jgi:hypothetical protein
MLVRENKESEPGIQEAYWFPNDEEIRLVETDENIPPNDVVTPFYFGAVYSEHPDENIPFDSALAMIRPEEVGKLSLPEGWGSWDDAIKLLPEEN